MNALDQRKSRIANLTEFAKDKKDPGLWNLVRGEAMRRYGLSRKTAEEYATVICDARQAQTIPA